MNILFRSCTADDLELLQAFSRKTYFETFAAANTPENMAAYLDQAFETEKLRSELSNEYSSFFFLYLDGALAGYLKLNEAPAQSELHDSQALEIERIYVAKEFQREGLGKYLMEQAIQTAIQRGKRYVWLGVWEKNEKALHFYQKHGFYRIGEHAFVMGDDRQTDYLMRKDL